MDVQRLESIPFKWLKCNIIGQEMGILWAENCEAPPRGLPACCSAGLGKETVKVWVVAAGHAAAAVGAGGRPPCCCGVPYAAAAAAAAFVELDERERRGQWSAALQPVRAPLALLRLCLCQSYSCACVAVCALQDLVCRRRVCLVLKTSCPWSICVPRCVVSLSICPSCAWRRGPSRSVLW